MLAPIKFIGNIWGNFFQFLIAEIDREIDRDFAFTFFCALFIFSSLTYYWLRYEISFYFAFTGFFLSLALRLFAKSNNVRFLLLIPIIFFFAFGLTQVRAHLKLDKNPITQIEELTLDAKVLKIIDRSNGGKMLEIITDDNLNRKLKIYVTRQSKNCNLFALNKQYRFHLEVRPFYAPAYFGSYDNARSNLLRGFAGQGFLLECLGETSKTSESFSVLLGFEKITTFLRGAVRKKIKANLEGDVQSLAEVVTTAYAGISSSQREKWQKVGLAHLLAISGLHVGSVGMFVFFLSRGIGLLMLGGKAIVRPEIIPALAAIGASFIYLLLSGFAISATRAMLMLLLFFISYMLNRKAITLRSVGLVAVIMVLIDPVSSLFPGFVLSFIAVTALVASYRGSYFLSSHKAFKVNILARVLAFFLDTAAASFIASVVTAPLVLYYFGNVSLVAVFTNIFAVPIFVFFVLPALTLSIAVMPFGFESFPLKLAGKALTIIDDIASFFESFNFAYFIIPRPAAWSVIIFCVGALLFFILKSRLKRFGLILAAAGAGAIAFTSFYVKYPDVIISGQGALLMVNSNDGYKVNSLRISSFERKEWERALALQKPADYWGNEFGDDDSYFQLSCERAICQYRAGESKTRIVFLYDLQFCPSNLSKNEKVILFHGANARKVACDKDQMISVDDLVQGGSTALISDKKGSWQIKNIESARRNRLWWVEQPLTKWHYGYRRN